MVRSSTYICMDSKWYGVGDVVVSPFVVGEEEEWLMTGTWWIGRSAMSSLCEGKSGVGETGLWWDVGQHIHLHGPQVVCHVVTLK